jgi:hypothetical protein
MYDEDDEDEQKDNVLGMLSGEVDDFAGKQLPDPNQGVTIEISVKPHGASPEMPEDDEKMVPKPTGMVDGNEDHDPIAHILGLCEGGCAY